MPSTWEYLRSISTGPSDTSEGIHISQPTHIGSVVSFLSQEQCNKKSTPYIDDVHMDLPTDKEEKRNDIAEIFGKAIGEIRYIGDST